MPRLPASLGSWTARAAPRPAASASVVCSSPFHSSAHARSHVGSNPVPIPPTVQIELPAALAAAAPAAAAQQAIVRGPKGQLAVALASFVRLQKQQQLVEGQAPDREHYVLDVENPLVKHQRAVWGLTRALLANAVRGVSEGYTLPIRLVGVGYRATVENVESALGAPRSDKDPKQRLNLKLGFAHPVLIDLPPDVLATTPAPNAVELSGIDKQRVGQVAAQIRAWRVPEPYNASPLPLPLAGSRSSRSHLLTSRREKGFSLATSRFGGRKSRRSSLHAFNPLNPEDALRRDESICSRCACARASCPAGRPSLPLPAGVLVEIV